MTYWAYQEKWHKWFAWKSVHLKGTNPRQEIWGKAILRRKANNFNEDCLFAHMWWEYKLIEENK